VDSAASHIGHDHGKQRHHEAALALGGQYKNPIRPATGN
jgi:hypothetical protein